MSSVCSHMWHSGFSAGLSPWLDSIKSHFPWSAVTFPWMKDGGGEDRGEWLGMLADALCTGGAGPSLLSGEWAIPGKWSENWYLILFVDLSVCVFPFLLLRSHLIEPRLASTLSSSHRHFLNVGMETASPCPVFYGTLRINAGLGAFVWKAVDKILANRIYLYLCVFRKYTIWKESQKWE